MRKGHALKPSDKEFHCRKNLNKNDGNNNAIASYVNESTEDFLFQIQSE